MAENGDPSDFTTRDIEEHLNRVSEEIAMRWIHERPDAKELTPLQIQIILTYFQAGFAQGWVHAVKVLGQTQIPPIPFPPTP
jgi:hypothetical protein